MRGVLGISHKFYVKLFSRNPVPLDLLNQIIPATEKKKIVEDTSKYTFMSFTASNLTCPNTGRAKCNK
jgi:hypothetical protein